MPAITQPCHWLIHLAVLTCYAATLQVWAGFIASNALLPLCAAYTVLMPHVDWSGTRYWKQRGRVVQVQRHSQQPVV